jgi:SAM-dependent methyltransferase
VAADEPTPLTARSFTWWPAAADLPTDTILWGPDIPTEAELRLLGHVEGKRILELGCGAGNASIALAMQGARLIAVEESGVQLGHARRQAEAAGVKIEWHQGDLAELAFLRADTVDAAFSVYTLDAVGDIDRVFRQVHRVLRPESPLIVSLPHPGYRVLDPAGAPPTFRRRYLDRTPVRWRSGKRTGHDHPRPVSDLLTSLSRASFRLDTMLEPAPAGDRAATDLRAPAMEWMPSTLIVRARKEGI